MRRVARIQNIENHKSNATSIFCLVGLRYIIDLYGLHVINDIILLSVSYFTSFINMVNVKINYFSLSLPF